MTNHGDRLREAFESHETQTPDPAAVYARVVELSARNKRRRRGMTAAGGAVLGAGLIAAMVNLPAILPGGPDGAGSATAPIVAAGPASPSVPAPSRSAEPNAEWAAYFGAGYDYDDAVKLARLWKMSSGDIGAVKAEGGRRLLAGETLPFAATPGDSDGSPVPGGTAEVPDEVTKFFATGYDYDDAVALAKLWKLKTPHDAKVAGGKRLLAGETLPIKPDKALAEKTQRIDAFFNAGYDFDDAAELAKLWKMTSYDAKIAAGKKLLAGETLPIKP